jgi:hypothetical protein
MGTEADKQNIGVIVTIVAVGAFAMIAVSLAVTALVRAEVKELSTERSATADLSTVRELKAGQRAALGNAAHWADRAKGLVAIPLERAMQLVGEDLRRNPHLATPSLPGKDEGDAGAPEPEKAPAEPEKAGEQKQSPEGAGGAKNAPAPAPQVPPAHAGGATGTAPTPAPTGSSSPTP